jgi:nitrogen-specific signal transduction histidine kinase
MWGQIPEGQSQTLSDPLGLPVIGMQLRSGPVLTLGGVLYASRPDAVAELSRRLDGYGVPLLSQQPPCMPAVSPDELSARAADVRRLYDQLTYTLTETSQLGRRSLALSAVEQINRLVLGTLNPEGFDLTRVMELTASSLVILLDADVSWAFSSHRPSHPFMVWRGGGVSLLSEACRAIESTLAGGQDIEATLLARLKLPGDISQPCLRHQSYLSRSLRLSIGVILPAGQVADKEIDSIISSLLSPLAVSCELSSLYSVIKRQVGTVINAIGHPVVVIDTRGRAGLINHAARTLLSEMGISIGLGEKLVGQGLGLAIDHAITEAVSGRVLLRESDRMPNGLVLNWTVTPLLDEDKMPAGAILVFEDVTETTMFRQRWVDWEKLSIAGQMAASLAHEIRSPLAAALGAIQLVRMPGCSHKRDEVLGRLETELSRMNRTLSDYLSLARPRDPQAPELIDVSAPLSEVEFFLRGEARLHNVDFAISVPRDQIVAVNAEPDALKQVFLNIGKNAFEAMPDGGQLRISLRRVGLTASIEFHDTGPGIPVELRSQVFRPFFTTKVNGTGLGLAVSRSIIRSMGGEITVEDSHSPGTKVVIQLPLATLPGTQRHTATNSDLAH